MLVVFNGTNPLLPLSMFLTYFQTNDTVNAMRSVFLNLLRQCLVEQEESLIGLRIIISPLFEGRNRFYKKWLSSGDLINLGRQGRSDNW